MEFTLTQLRFVNLALINNAEYIYSFLTLLTREKSGVVTVEHFSDVDE